jgi:hypothetical protein
MSSLLWPEGREQCRDRHTESIGEFDDAPQGGIPVRRLDPRQVRAMDAGALGQLLLRPAFLATVVLETFRQRP